MKVNPNYLAYAAITLSMVAIVLFLSHKKDNNENKQAKSIETEKDERAFFWQIYPELVIQTEGTLIDKNTAILDTAEHELMVHDLFGGRTRDSILIFRFSKFDCDVCIKETIPILKKAFGEQPDRVLLLVDGMSPRDFRIKYKDANILFPTYFIKEGLKLPLENKNIPFFFILDKTRFSASKLFLPNKLYPQQTRAYLKNVLPLIQ